MASIVEADWWLWFIIAISVAIFLGANVYTIILWQHPDDKNESYIAKAIVLVGMTLAEVSILMLPLDVANNAGNVECGQAWSNMFCGSLDMEKAWSVIYIATFVMAFYVVPFTIFFYEEDDSLAMEGTWRPEKAFSKAFKYMAFIGGLVLVVLLPMYFYAGYSYLPVDQYAYAAKTLLSKGTHTIQNSDGSSNTLTSTLATTSVTESKEVVELTVSFAVYVMAWMSFIGWFLFVFFAGLGFPAIPIDATKAYFKRPKRLDRAQIASLELSIQRRVAELIEFGLALKHDRDGHKRAGDGNIFERGRRNRSQRVEFNKFKPMVYLLEEDYDVFRVCKDYAKSYNPLAPFLWLLAGMVGFVVSLLWIIHIVIYVLINPSVAPFLNKYFVLLDNVFPLFGVLSIYIFTMYLLLATIKGCFKWGLRLGFVSLHPMKINGTYMNSFLFNIGIVLMCTAPIVLFSVQAFQAYAVNTDVNNLLNVQVRYVKYFRWFYSHNFFVYMLVIMICISYLWLGAKPHDVNNGAKDLKRTLQRIDRAEGNTSAKSTPTRPSRPQRKQRKNKDEDSP